MLIQFKVKNFRSFRDEQVLSMVAATTKDTTHPDSIQEVGEHRLLKTAAIFGANASGKSNLVKAMDFGVNLVCDSATRLNVGDQIPVAVPFRLDAKTQDQACEVEFVVLLNGVVYEYGFAATAARVEREWLHVKPKGKGKKATWLLRTGSSPKKWTVAGPLAKDQELLREKTRPNCLVLSRGAELNCEPLLPLFTWFVRACVAMPDGAGYLFRLATFVLEEMPELLCSVARYLKDADTGISDVSVIDKTLRNGAKVNSSLASQSIKGTPQALSVQTRHHVEGLEEPVFFDMEQDESHGTHRYFALITRVLVTLRLSSLLVVDELDCSIHPLLSRKLVELFHNKELNPNGAQLIFTTHDGSLMHPDLLRRDQIWFAEKTDRVATSLYSLYDFEDRPRNDTAFEKNYRIGKYGGVPIFGPALEDLETD
jgi:hypothetical protein